MFKIVYELLLIDQLFFYALECGGVRILNKSLEKKYKELKKKLLENSFSRMNANQKEAVFSVNGPLVVVAGAGSGKTTVIINRIVNYIGIGLICPKCKTKYKEDSYAKAKEKQLSKMVKKEMPKLDDEDLDTEILLKMTDSMPADEEGMEGMADNLAIEDEEDMETAPQLDEILDDYSDEKDI